MALACALALAGPAGAICEPSGAFDVATHHEITGAIVIWDSVGMLWESPDDTANWYPTNRLPLGSARAGDEVCLADGRCLRIRADRLGIERGVPGSFQPAWAYPDGRVDFLERQTNGPCGEGHGELGLRGLIVAPQGSAWDVFVAAGADGLYGLMGDEVDTGLYGSSASIEAPLSEIYLAPEVVGVLLVALALGLWMNLWFGSSDARGQALAMAAASVAGVGIALMPRLGLNRFELILVTFALAGVGFWLVSRRFHVDAAEITVASLWGVGAGFIPYAVHSSHEAVVFAYTLGGTSAALLVGSWWASRERAGERGARLPWAMAVGAALGGLVVYLAWGASVIVSKQAADAGAAAVGIAVVAWALAPRAQPVRS